MSPTGIQIITPYTDMCVYNPQGHMLSVKTSTFFSPFPTMNKQVKKPLYV